MEICIYFTIKRKGVEVMKENCFGEVYDLDEIELTDEVVDWILAGTDEMLDMLAAAMTEGE